MKHHINNVNNLELRAGMLMLNINHQPVPVYLDRNSGRPIKRKKTNTIIGVQHTGVRLGKTGDGVTIVAHNHYKVGRPAIATFEQFAKGEKVQWDDKKGDRPMLCVIQSVIAQIKNGNSYHVRKYNCQHFVNIAVRQEHRSESLMNVAAGFGGALVAAGLIGLLIGGSKRG